MFTGAEVHSRLHHIDQETEQVLQSARLLSVKSNKLLEDAEQTINSSAIPTIDQSVKKLFNQNKEIPYASGDS